MITSSGCLGAQGGKPKRQRLGPTGYNILGRPMRVGNRTYPARYVIASKRTAVANLYRGAHVIDAIAGKIKMDETAKGRARTAWVTVLMNYATGETLKYLGGLRFQKTEGTKDFGLLGKDTMNGNMVLPEGCLIRTEEDAMVESDRFFDLISAIIRDRKRGVVAKVQALTTLMDFSQGEALEYFSHLRGVIIKNNRDIFRRQ